jgi:aspartate racemase
MNIQQKNSGVSGKFCVCNNQKEMLLHLEAYNASLHLQATSLRKRGHAVVDQSFENSCFSLLPFKERTSHILLLGGMGPLAGINGMHHALSLFQTLPLSLYQACFVPPREHGDTAVFEYLYEALKAAVLHIPSHHTIELVVLCNSAHDFMPRVLELFQKKHKRIIHFHSLKSCVQKNVMIFHKKGIVLQTKFSARQGIYTKMSNLCPLESFSALKRYGNELSLAIEGVKHFDTKKVLQHGSILFQALHEQGIEQILMGCTEVPIIVKILQEHATPQIQMYLKSVELIDPVVLTLHSLKETYA